MKTAAHSPFGYLAESLNFWTLEGWTTSNTSGVTIGPPVTKTTTSPTPYWSCFGRFKGTSDGLAGSAVHLAPVASDFGLMIGGRAGAGRREREYTSRIIATDETPAAGDMDLAEGWYDSRPSNTRLTWDPRGPWDNTVLSDFLDCIKTPDGADLGPYFRPDSANPGLVLFIVNESLQGGTSWDRAIGVTTRVLESSGEIKVANSGELVSHGKLATSSGIRSAWQTVFPEYAIESIAAVLGHEMGHALGLGDEYESEGDPLRKRCPSDEAAEVETNPNLMHQDNLRDGPEVAPLTDPLQPLNIKWNWRRVSFASRTVDETTWSSRGGGLYSCFARVRAEDKERWDEAMDLGRPVYLRRSACATTPEPGEIGPASIVEIAGPVTIGGVEDPEGNQIIVELSLDPSVDDVPTGETKFEKGSVLYVPKVKDEDWTNPIELKLISDSVLQFMAASRDALYRKPTEDKENRGNWTWNVDSALTPFVGSFPKHNIVGLFEGGHRYNCGVFRPSALCRMSFTYKKVEGKYEVVSTHFCPVCKFAIVDEVEPERHADLDDGDFEGRWTE
jgi:hypothetical protein